jgi:D-sedoheptulose 7-phosphate isomerase
VLSARGGAGAVTEAVEVLLATRRSDAEKSGEERKLRAIIVESIRAHQRLLDQSLPELARISAVLSGCLRKGGKVLLCGNGGSAADARHVAAELVGRIGLDRDPVPAIALSTDISTLAVAGSDVDLCDVFALQVRAMAQPGDVVVGLSPSGASPNVVRALKVASERGARTLGFVGRDGGPIAELAELAFRAPDTVTSRVQELHLLAWNAVCEIIEPALASPEAEVGQGS